MDDKLFKEIGAKAAPFPVAITGVSALYPGSTDKVGFWHNILAGKDLITDVPATHWRTEDYYDPNPAAPDKTYCKRGAFLSQIPFNSLEFGIPPNSLPSTDTAQLLALIVARQVLEDASRGQFSRLNRDRISVILGVASGTELLGDMAARLERPVWMHALQESGIPLAKSQEICDRISRSYVPWQESTFPGLLGNVVAGRIANRLDLHGTNCVVDAACASSLASVAIAVNELYRGDSDLAIVGGVDALNNILMYMCFSKTPALSPTGDCRPFSDKADGTMLGEGMGMFALRRLADAERDGDPIYAVLQGIGSSSDGTGKSVYAPEPAGQAIALRRAYAAAGFGADTVELVEAHGTGTKAGDAAEFSALRKVYDESNRKDRQWCALGSVKSQIGHTKAAAGAAGMFKAVMALHHKVLPPTIKVDRPNPAMDFENSPFHLNTRARPWIRSPAHPRRAAVSSFGFGGSNFHLALEEYTGPGKTAGKLRTFSNELITLSTDSVEELVAACRKMEAECATAGVLAYLAWRSQQAFDPVKTFRLALIACDEKELSAKLARAGKLLQCDGAKPFADPKGIYFGTGALAGKVAFLFPGQGSQYVDMGAAAAMGFDAARLVWDAAAAESRADTPSLQDIVFPKPVFDEAALQRQQAKLTETEWAQPAIGIASLSYLALLKSIGVKPDYVAGHSFGEVTALHAAGVLNARDFLAVARKRGALMAATAKATPGGAMTAAAAPPEMLLDLEANGIRVSIANFNGPKQTVLSGDRTAIEKAEQYLEKKGVTCRRVPVETAFHTPFVSGCCGPFEDFLQGISFSNPEIPVYSNAEAQPYPSLPEAMKQLLAKQIGLPVLFTSQIEAMYAQGVRIFVEVGPGGILTGRISECLESKPHLSVAVDRKSASGLTAFWQAVAQLAAAGVSMELQALWSESAAPSDPFARNKPAHAVLIGGSNYGKPNIRNGQTQRPAAGPAAPVDAAQRSIPSLKSPTQKAVSVVPIEIAKSEQQRSETVTSTTLTHNNRASVLNGHRPLQITRPSAPFKSVGPAPASGQRQSPAVLSVHPLSSEVLPMKPDTHPDSIDMVEVPPATGSLSALIEMQRQTVETQQAFQQGMVDVQMAYLRTMEFFLQKAAGVPVSAIREGAREIAYVPRSRDAAPALSGAVPAAASALTTGVPVSTPTVKSVAFAAEPGPQVAARAAASAPAVASPPPASGLKPEAPRVMARAAAPNPILPPQSMAPADTELPQPQVRSTQPTTGLVKQMLLETVSQKTGYPIEALDLDMELEGELGIDSIKRVEILGAMQGHFPDMPEVSTKEMASLRTLGEIVAHLDRSLVPEKKESLTAEAPV